MSKRPERLRQQSASIRATPIMNKFANSVHKTILRGTEGGSGSGSVGGGVGGGYNLKQNNIFISQIVYPKNILDYLGNFYLIGWNTQQFECIIAGMIGITSFDSDLYKSYNIINEAIRLAYQNPQFILSADQQGKSSPYHRGGGGGGSVNIGKAPMILGIYQSTSSMSLDTDYTIGKDGETVNFPIQDFQNNGIWITLSKESVSSVSPSVPALSSSSSSSSSLVANKLKLQSIYSSGYRYNTISYLIEYNPLDCQQLYSIVSSSYYKENFLFPTYFLTTAQADLLQSIDIENKEHVNVLPVMKTEKKHEGGLYSRRSKVHTPTNTSTVDNNNQSTATGTNKQENIRIILQQLNASEDLMFWIFYHLKEMTAKPLLSNERENNTNNKTADTILQNYSKRLNFFTANKLKITLYERIIAISVYFVYIWSRILRFLERLLRLEIPLIRNIVYFCNWKEIAAAQVTVRDNMTVKEGSGRSTSPTNPPIQSTERTLNRKNRPQNPRNRLNSFENLFSMRSWINSAKTVISIPSALINRRGDEKLVDSPYSLYRYSFFFFEIIQTIEQYQLLFDLYYELYPQSTNAMYGTSNAKEEKEEEEEERIQTNNKNFSSPLQSNNQQFLRKYFYLQILHHLFYLILNAILGYIVSYYFSTIDQPAFLHSIIALLHHLHQNYILSNLAWISSSPIGIKLNSYVVEKTNSFIIETLQLYSLSFIKQYYSPACLLFLQFFYIYFPFSGISYQICLLLDTIMMITFPIHVIYFLLVAIFRFHRHLLYSLWLFFNGKKYNIFRQRIDTYHYSSSSFSTTSTSSSSSSSSSTSSSPSSSYYRYYYSNQLLFGVLLFSIMFFLLPTIIVYYCLFLWLRVIITSVYFAGWNVIMLIKKFPIVYYVYYWFDYEFFTNRWYLEVNIPSSSSLASGRILHPTDEKTVGAVKQRKLRSSFQSKKTFEIENKEKMKSKFVNAEVMADTSENSQPSEVSSDSEAFDKKTEHQHYHGKKQWIGHAIRNPLLNVSLPDYPSPSHNKLRNRKNLMMSLTEKYRKEEEEEEAQQLLQDEQQRSLSAPPSGLPILEKNYSPESVNRESDIPADETRMNQGLSLAVPLPLESSSHDDDPFASTNAFVYNDLMSLSEFSEDISPRGHTFSDQFEDSPTIEMDQNNNPALLSHHHQHQHHHHHHHHHAVPPPLSTSMKTPTIQSIHMKLSPARFNFFTLCLATIELFYTSPFTMMNRLSSQYSFNKLTIPQKIFKFFSTIASSYPLYLIYENNTLRFTIFSTDPNSSSSTSSTFANANQYSFPASSSPSTSFESADPVNVIVRKEIKLISELKSHSFRNQNEGSIIIANPFQQYYQKKLLMMIVLVYSLYLIAFMIGITCLLWNQIHSFFLLSGETSLSSSSFENLQKVTTADRSNAVNSTRSLLETFLSVKGNGSFSIKQPFSLSSVVAMTATIMKR